MRIVHAVPSMTAPTSGSSSPRRIARAEARSANPMSPKIDDSVIGFSSSAETRSVKSSFDISAFVHLSNLSDTVTEEKMSSSQKE